MSNTIRDYFMAILERNDRQGAYKAMRKVEHLSGDGAS